MPSIVIDHYSIRVYFGSLLHLHIKRSKYLGVQAWTDDNANYSIEFALKGGFIRTVYSDRDAWETIIKALDQSFI